MELIKNIGKKKSITYSTFTDTGGRERNEDALLADIREGISVFLVADGLGGHKGGKEAAEFVADYISGLIKDEDVLSTQLLEKCFDETQEKLMEMRAEAGDEKGTKTTLTLFLTDGVKAAWGHIGDTRLYHFRGRRIVSKTLDHTAAQMLVMLGKLKPEEVALSKDRNRLTGAMGNHWSEPMYQIDTKPVRIGRRDRFLICSDGFWEAMDEKSAADDAFSLPAEDALKKIQEDTFKRRDELKKNGSFDNATAVLIRIN